MTLPLTQSPPSPEEPTATAGEAPPAPGAAAPAGPPGASLLPPPPPPSLTFPADWLLANATAPIQYRAISDVAESPELARTMSAVPLGYGPAITLALTQAFDGTWSGSMLTLPSARAKYFEGVGTINAVRRLLEYGWGRETPPVHQSRRVLFRLLAEDESAGVLYEFAEEADDEEMIRRGRAILRDASAAALAQAGFEADPRLRGAARRILMRAVDFIRSPLAQKPFVRVGNQHALAADAAPPSIYGLAALAHMPSFRTEFHDELDSLCDYLEQPLPRMEAVQLCGGKLVPQPQLVLGDLLGSKHIGASDLPWMLHWLELMARLGFLRRNEGWMKLFERLVDQCDASGVWKPGRSTLPESPNPYTWHMWPLDPGHRDGAADVTFRLGLIAKLLGWEIVLA